MSGRLTWDQVLAAAMVSSVVLFVPLMVLRLRAAWRIRASVPTTAAAVLAVALGLWWVSGLEVVWLRLPAPMRGVQTSGSWAIAVGAALHAFMVAVGSDVPIHRLRRTIVLNAVVAALVFAIVAGLSVMGPACHDPNWRVCASSPRSHDGRLVSAVVIAGLYLVVVLAHSAWLGLRHFRRSAAGWGMGMLAAGCLADLVPVVHGFLYRQLSPAAYASSYTEAPWLEAVPTTAGTVLLFTGFAYPPVAVRIRAWRRLQLLKPLWHRTRSLYPALAPSDAVLGNTLPERCFEQIAYIQDAITLYAQQRHTPLAGTEPPTAIGKRAQAVARWLAGAAEPSVSCRWLHPPHTTSSQDWVLAIASAYRRYVPEAPSESPSTLRR